MSCSTTRRWNGSDRCENCGSPICLTCLSSGAPGQRDRRVCDRQIVDRRLDNADGFVFADAQASGLLSAPRPDSPPNEPDSRLSFTPQIAQQPPDVAIQALLIAMQQNRVLRRIADGQQRVLYLLGDLCFQVANVAPPVFRLFDQILD